MGMFNKIYNTSIHQINNITEKNKIKIINLVLNNLNFKLAKLNNMFTSFYHVNFKNKNFKLKKINNLKKNIITLSNLYKKILKIYIIKSNKINKKIFTRIRCSRDFRKKILIYNYNNN